jgi:hypothetical protein
MAMYLPEYHRIGRFPGSEGRRRIETQCLLGR